MGMFPTFPGFRVAYGPQDYHRYTLRGRRARPLAHLGTGHLKG